MLKRQIFPITTSGAGAASVTGTAVLGTLYAIEYRPGAGAPGIVTGATLTVTCESDTSKALLTKANAGTANTWYYPRDLVHATADGAELTGSSGGDRACPILHGALKVTIAAGGSGKVGSVVFYYDVDEE